MQQKTRDYAQEFDEVVVQYNGWLENPEVGRKNRWDAFFRGMRSVLDLFGASFSSMNLGHLYSREDLTAEQKDAIALASDLQRVDRTLDKICSGEFQNSNISVRDATAEKLLVHRKYDHYKSVYVFYAMRK